MRLLRDRRGFSMMELLVAIIVIALGLLALSGLFPLGSRTRMQGEERTRAIQLAQQQIERLAEKGYDSLTTNLHDSTYIRTYRVEWWVSTIGWGQSRFDSLKVVTDTVAYFRPGRGWEKVGLTTYVSPKITRVGG